MSWYVTALVRLARLPRKKIKKRRPATKLVLLALADRADHDGTNARPSVATIGAESEISEHIVAACLDALCRARLITEQAKPGQHRPRTWRLNLVALRALADPHHVAELETVLAEHQVRKNGGSAPQNSRPAPQNSRPAPQHGADELPSERVNNERGGAAAAPRPHRSRSTNKQPEQSSPLAAANASLRRGRSHGVRR